MAKIKAKFNVMEITKYGNGGGGKVTLSPVVGGDNPENKEFWEATPSGKIELCIDNPAVMQAFEFGEYYVEFTKAE
jgi:hypothetical protein